jgi:hypothetical protein
VPRRAFLARAHADGGAAISFSRRTSQMSSQPKRIPIDWWAVIAALGAAVLIKAQLLPHVPW